MPSTRSAGVEDTCGLHAHRVQPTRPRSAFPRPFLCTQTNPTHVQAFNPTSTGEPNANRRDPRHRSTLRLLAELLPTQSRVIAAHTLGAGRRAQRSGTGGCRFVDPRVSTGREFGGQALGAAGGRVCARARACRLWRSSQAVRRRRDSPRSRLGARPRPCGRPETNERPGRTASSAACGIWRISKCRSAS